MGTKIDNLAEMVYDLEPKPRSFYTAMSDAEVESQIKRGVIERLPDGMLKVTAMGRERFVKLIPALMKANEFAAAAGVTDLKEIARIAYLFHKGDTEELKNRYPCPCPRCVAERAGLDRGCVVAGSEAVN